MIIILVLLFGFIGLIWAANHLITGASGIAIHYRLTPLIIGLTIVAIATSAPEITISLFSAMEGRNDLAIGNAVGSNIANIGLILGLILLLRPLTTRSSLLRREYPLLILSMLFAYSLVIDGYLGVLDGCLLILGCIVLIGYFIFIAQHSSRDIFAREYKQYMVTTRSVKANVLSLLLGMIVLPFSAHFVVNSAVQLATWFGVNELKIGLTIIAIGTSLPQITTSLVAAFKGLDDIAVGNILGSNMYNLLLVMAFPGIINPSAINHAILWRDIPIMFIITGVLLLINYREKKKITRWHGGLLLLIYGCYILSLVVHA
ncbi:calcium/sodium antiporter [Legionella oakridgensis]|uniref:Na/Ca antiporter n=1 Tax=Legionella oakridgensis TaxID=29423 RepID=A0A0W0XG13_9GAMM|nr:calcium/sodium antiporter [Legionella oakridgensis]ETO92968.1 K+-dependent Na+/Ca+ exchanger related-protein [Legionella oakridgensis RV-2-2007]KTD43496.1 Na/Ca antiporter [Legionella oakridgensis]STY20488.1 Ca2 /Na antiporter [Legionella longbeachae]